MPKIMVLMLVVSKLHTNSGQFSVSQPLMANNRPPMAISKKVPIAMSSVLRVRSVCINCGK